MQETVDLPRRFYSGVDLTVISMYYIGLPVVILCVFRLNLLAWISLASFYILKILVTR